MAINGEKFLKLNHATHLAITPHALRRIYQYTGINLSFGEAIELFSNAKHMKYDELIKFGYRPNYHGRLSRGESSWYFRNEIDDIELIFVVGKKNENHDLLWITTFVRNLQSEILRQSNSEVLAKVA